ncbi:MAG: hypothetical protein ABII27_01875 [bacterium]
MKKYFLFLMFAVFFMPGILSARVNYLESFNPGHDLAFKSKDWTNHVNTTFISDSDFKIIDLTYSGFLLINPYLESGISWSLRRIDPDIADSETGPSDIALGLKYNILKKNDLKKGEPVIITEALISIPNGDSTKALGAGGYGLGLNTIIATNFDPIVGSMDFGYTTYTRGNNRREGGVLTYSLFLDWNYSEDIMLIGGIKGFNNASDKINNISLDNDADQIYFVPGINFLVNKKTIISSSIFIGLNNDSADIILFAGIEF